MFYRFSICIILTLNGFVWIIQWKQNICSVVRSFGRCPELTKIWENWDWWGGCTVINERLKTMAIGLPFILIILPVNNNNKNKEEKKTLRTLEAIYIEIIIIDNNEFAWCFNSNGFHWFNGHSNGGKFQRPFA